MSVRTLRRNLDAARTTLEKLKVAFSKQYWYCHPKEEGANVVCFMCGQIGNKHIESPNGYLCPEQPETQEVKHD